MPKLVAFVRSCLRYRTVLLAVLVTALVLPQLNAAPTPEQPALTPVAAPTTPLSAKVDFTTPTGALAAGYTRDSGLAYSETSGFGWIRQDSLAGPHVAYGTPQTGTTLNAGNTRDRNTCTTVPQHQRSFIHMQAPAAGSNDPTPVAWEYALANGRYQVSVGVGDPSVGGDPEAHTIHVEGVTAFDRYGKPGTTGCTTTGLRINTVWVDVTDGKLTVDAVGGTNTKLGYVTIDSVPVEGLTATPGGSGIALDWNDVAGATGYQVRRSTTLPVLPTATPVSAPTTSAYTDATAVAGQVYYYSVTPVGSVGSAGGDVVRGMIDAAEPVSPTLPLKVNFQGTEPGSAGSTGTNASATPAGWTGDFGQNYANSRGFGWVDAGTSVPVDLTANGRWRADEAPTFARTLTSTMHMQYNNVGGTANGNPRAGSWQVSVPNGSYDVTVAVGDASPGTDPTTHVVNVEGTKTVEHAISTTTAPTGAARFKTGDARVTVNDGFLTVDALGGVNTKIDYLTVTPTPSDLPPAAPTGLVATPGDASVSLDWADNTEADLDGYRVYRGTGTTVSTSGTPVSGATPVTESSFRDATAVNGTTYRYVVVAVDDAGQASPASASVTAEPDAANATLVPLPVNIAFGTETTATPAGWLKDYGQPFSNNRGRGFVQPGSQAPVSLVGNGRYRDVRPGVTVLETQRGLMHLRANQVVGSFNGVKVAGDYEVAVPNGKYDVTLSAGDQPGATTATCVEPCYDSVHTLLAEGTTVIDGFQADEDHEFAVATKRVTVSDGRLTISAGGTNAKVNYLRVVAVDVTAPAAPTALAAAAADSTVSLTWAAPSDTDVVGYRVYRSTTSPVTATEGNRLTATPLAAPGYTDAAVTNGTTYHYVVTALDAEGNESPVSGEASAEPADTTAPAAPSTLNVSAGDTQATLSWTASDAPDLDGYRVYRSTTSPVLLDEDDLVGEPSEATFVAEGLTNGTTYYFAVTAVDEAGNESTLSPETSVVPTPAPDTTVPAAPDDVAAAAGDGKVTVSWTANSESDLAGYRVLRSAVNGSGHTEVGRVTADKTEYVDTTVVNATAYYYVVVAADLAGNVSPSSTQVSATPKDSTPPAVPAGLSATAGVQRVTLSWTPNTESDLRGYEVYRFATQTPAIDADHLIGMLIKPGRTFVDADLEPGVPQYYAIVAYDALGNRSAATTVVTATPAAAPDTTAPGAPTGLTATVVDGNVKLGWNAVSAADLAGYNVYRSATAGGARVKLTATPLTGATYTDTGAPAGQTAHYVVTAVDTSANESVASTGASADVPANGVALKFTFTTAAAAAVAGFAKDTGAGFTDARGYGWVTQSSLSSASHTPLDLTANTRLRTRTTVSDLQNRAIHMQYGDIVPTPTSAGDLTPGAWEYALPSGRYTVEVSVGDQPGGAKTGCAAPCYDSTHTVRAEGSAMVTGFQATAAVEYRTGTTTVDVTDGRLTIDAIGGSNTKLNWVTITGAGPIAPDTTAPGAPSSLTALAGDTAATLSWAAPGDADVAGYHVYRGTGPTVDAVPANRVSTSLVQSPSFSDQGLTNGTEYRYVVTSVDTAGNESLASVSAAVTPLAGAGANVAMKVNFADAATVPPTGYLTDFGQAFGARTSPSQGTGLSYGWVRIGTSTPVSIEGNGRNRNTQASAPTSQPDLRLATFIHTQLPANVTTGVHVDGSWEVAVPNGIYTVTVGVGDPGEPVDSSHWMNIENQNAVAAFVPSASSKFATATRTVSVTDGRLTLSPAGGTNTKLDYVDIASLDRAGRPYTSAVTPANLSTGIVNNTSVATDNVLNADTGAVDGATLGNGSVTLTRVSDGANVAGTGATSGGGDTISFLPSAPLQGGVLYRFTVTSGAKDKSGRAFLPFSSVFTTASGSGGGGGTGDLSGVAFDRTDSGAALGGSYTSLVVGPDGKLYAGSIMGQIFRWTINADGTLANRETINTVRTHASTSGWEGAPNRTVIGLAFDPASTADNLILWISDNYAYLGSEVPDATGAIARLSGANLQNYQEVVVNLPRSIKDHETNSIAFKDGKLLITQGSMNAMGAKEGTWKKDEHLLSAAMLQLDPANLPASLPLDVATPDLNAPARNGVPAHTGTYDPYAAGAPLSFYATGIRNAFDLVVHSNGRIYTGTNGSAAGGATPATPTTFPASCAKRPQGPYTGPAVPAIANNQQAETDYLFDVHQGKYYGHPNPQRCEYVLNAGNPTGYTGNPLFKVNAYPSGTLADPNYDLEHVHDAGLHASANGTIEYKNTVAFGGKLAGKVIVVRYSANQEVVVFNVDSDGGVSAAVTGITGFTGFKQPLDIAQDPTNGNLYVSELTDNPATTGIKLLKPQGGGSAAKVEATPRLVFTDVQGGTASAAKSVAVKNIGGLPLTISAANITGADSARFALASGGPALPTTVQPGSTVTFPVTFNPAAAGPQGATLQLTTNDPASPTTSVTLRGLGTVGLGGTNEPSLQWILDTLQIPVNVGDPDKTNNDMPVTSPLIGEEVAMPAFTKAAFDRVVTITPLSLFGPAGPAGNTNTAVLAAHNSADPTQRVVLQNGPNGSNQQVLPQWTQVGEYDLDATFGFDVTWPGLSNRVTYSEDALNTWATNGNTHKIRVYPMKNPDGSVVPNTFIVAPEDVADGVDFQDAAFVVGNVKAPVVSGAGKVSVDPSELVFSGVRGTTSAAKTVVVSNNGTTPLQVTGVSVTGTNAASFTATATPQSVPVGGTMQVSVRYNPPSGSTPGAQSAVLQIASDDSVAPTKEIGLYGLVTPGEQGNNEPPLKAVVDTLGHPINVGGTGLILGTNPAPIGDEVKAPLFTKAGTEPVTLTPVARYSPDELLPFGWYEPNSGEPITHEIATIALDQEQTLNPAIVTGGTTTFDPGAGTFGVYVDSKSFGRKTYTQDGLNTNIPHGARIYPAKNRAGALLPNTYLVTFEDAQNGDYQDYVFRMTGAKPAGGAGTGTPLARIDYKTATGTVADGYTADTGAAFTAERGFGWVRPGTATPLDMTAQTRDRAGSADRKLQTLVLMQPTATQSPDGPGTWEYAVPNGTYTVTVGVGDSGFTDSTHRVQVEGVTAIAGFTPTTGAPFSSATVTVPVSDGRLTVDATGGTNTKLTYLDIDVPSSGADVTAPTVSVGVSGLRTAATTYKNEATVSVTASDTGSGLASTSYSLDGGAFAPYTQPVKVTTLGNHTVRARAQDVAGNIATTTVSTFSIVAAGASQANAVIENADGVPFTDRLTMNRIQTPQTGTTCKEAGCDPAAGPFIPANVVHDTASLVVRNTGTDGLNVTELLLTGPFALVNPPALPALVPAGGSLTVTVRFTATAIGTNGGLWDGSLTVASDDPAKGSIPVELAGFWQSQSENNQEPDVTELAKLFGYTTAITSGGDALNQKGAVRASGDEVLSPYWLRADTTAPVSVRQLAAFHTQGNTASFFWHNKDSSSTTTLFTHAGVEGQSILPHRNGSTTAAASGTFTPTGAFGLKIDGEWSDPARNNQATDVTNGCVAPCGHHVRAWAVRDRSGAIVPNTWLVGMDYSGINYDYNDNLFLVSNMRPETAANPAAPAPLPGASSLQLPFGAALAGTLADATGAGTGFTSTQRNRLDVATGSSSYDPTKLHLTTTGAGTLAIDSSGAAAAGSPANADNTLVNGLQLPFDGDGGTFTVTARTLGGLAGLDTGSEQQGVMLGSDQDNFVKLAAINRSGVPGIELYGETGGAGATVGTAVNLPSPGTITSLDLALVGKTSTRTVKAAYRINDGAWVVLPTSYTVPVAAAGKIFGARTYGGILATHKGGAPFTATFDSFGVSAGDLTTGPASRDALYRLDVAGTGSYTDTQGRVWTPDTGRFSPSTAPAEGLTQAPQEIAGTQDDVLYRSYRGNVGNVAQAQRVLSYALPSKGATTVDLRLHFAERATANNTAGKRLFDIGVEGATVRKGFDIFSAAGGQNTATVLSIDDVAVKGGVIDLSFAATVDYPSIAAIEVLCQGPCPAADTTAPSAPTGLGGSAGTLGISLDWNDVAATDLVGYHVYRSSSATGTFTKITGDPVTTSGYVDTTPGSGSVYYQVRAIDSSENLSDASATFQVVPATQQPIRINAGGPAQTVGGTTWAACSAVGTCSGWVSGGNAYSEADTITGIPAGMNNTMFQSEWTGGQNSGSAVGTRAFGFSVPVSNGAYTVRLHFAELNKNAANLRLFDVRLEGAAALSNFDVYAAAGGIDKAVTRDLRTNVTDGAVTIDFITRKENAKVSAIEIIPTVPDTTAPGVVTGVTATGSGTGVALGWAASSASDLAGYNVYRSATATGTFTKVNAALVTGTTYADATAPEGVSYYQVTAVDSSANESARSATVNGTRTDTTAPGVVTGVAASGSANGVTTTWSASTASDLAGYNVYRSATATGTFTKVNSALVTATTYLDAAAPNGVSYYRVTAVDRAGNESAPSTTVNGTRTDTTPPPAVTGVAASGSANGVTTTWSASTASDLAGYNVYRSATATGTFTKVNGALVTATTYLDAAAPSGVSYYRVTAVDRAGNESVPSTTVNGTRTDTTPPPAVTGVAASGSANGVTTTWSASTASDLAGYNVYRSATATGTFTKVNSALVTATTYLDAAAPNGVSYYRVTAVDRAGNESVPSTTVNGTRADTTAPAVVTGVTATRVPSGVTVTWSASSAADLAGYNVYRSATATGTFTKVNGALVTTTTFTHTDAPSSASYYRVTAVDTSTNESVPSGTATVAAVDTTAPGVVTGLAATSTSAGISVSWNASGAADLAGYTVYRAASATGTYTKVNTALVTGTTLSDTGAPLGATSYYQVTATDQSGNESARSATVNATRAAAPQQPIRINAGGPAQTVGGTTWAACSALAACSGRVTGGNAYSEADTVTGIPSGMNNTMFQSEWTGGQASGVAVGARAFGFSVPVSNGAYTVRLHFAELNKNAANLRLFDVRMEGITVLSNFDVFAAAGGIDKAVAREFRTNVTDGAVTIDFVTRRENAKVSAIEIIPVTDTTAPGTVTGVTASAATSGNTLGWAASSAGDLAGYNVYRSASATGGYTKLNTALLTGRTYVDGSAPTGVASYYQVTAVDTSGNESARSATVSATRPATTRPTIRINAGGPVETAGGTTWSGCASLTACSGQVSGGFAYSENDTIAAVPASMNQALFRSEWTGGQSNGVAVGSRAFGFDVPVANGRYLVRLHFAELNKNAANLRLFDVRLEGTTVLSNFDVFAAAGGIDRAVAREFTTTVTDGAATIDFITRKENAKVSAIELIPVS